jgi:hypothetical protein
VNVARETNYAPSPEEIAEQARKLKEEHLRAKREEAAAPSKPLRTLPPREALETSRKYHGITWTGWKWRAKALDPATGKSVHSADFDDPAEAARAYDKLLVQVNRLAAEPNFPDEMPASWRARATGPAKQTLPWAAEIKPETEPAPEPERPAHKFRGITLRRNGDWVAQVKIPGSGTKMTWIARCRTAEEAARKYDAYVVKHDLGKPLNFSDEHPGYSPRPGAYRAKPHEAKAFVARMTEAESRAAEPKPSPPVPVAEEAAPPLLVARPEPANPWGRLQAKIEAVADLLSVLRRHPADVGRDALMYIMESTR